MMARSSFSRIPAIAGLPFPGRKRTCILWPNGPGWITCPIPCPDPPKASWTGSVRIRSFLTRFRRFRHQLTNIILQAGELTNKLRQLAKPAKETAGTGIEILFITAATQRRAHLIIHRLTPRFAEFRESRVVGECGWGGASCAGPSLRSGWTARPSVYLGAG